MRISDWSSDVCSSDLYGVTQDELDREITSFRARYENAVKSASTRDSVALAGKLVYAVNDRQVFAAPATSLDIFNAAVEGLTLEKVNAIAKTMFTGQEIGRAHV